MATADNFTIDNDNLGGLHDVAIEVENPIDHLGNQRGLTGPARVTARRYADMATAKLFKAYIGNNGVCTPIAQIAFDVYDNQGRRVFHLTMYNVTVISWSMTSPEQPAPLPDGQQPPMLPDVEGFVLVSTHSLYQSGGKTETCRILDASKAA